ncbi:hypothetical protein LC048_20180 [Mesobacillus subterraneus]|uniref:hypothetical protein n=1 Tax=Mesobacillus subterraneus TaxID=285983 RepID=UPI00273E3BA8|nr:hypothetical protein [Mesobacillus subterraneus]WLR54700.1 hypothetical protein LC048_20180 [Mesobacillus subterraneus]
MKIYLRAVFISDFRFLLAIFKIYWRKINFIGDNALFIGENQFLLATWKFSLIFSSFDTRKLCVQGIAGFGTGKPSFVFIMLPTS